MTNEWLRVSLALLIILAIILALSWLLKRLNGGMLNASKGFQSIATMVLGPKEKLMLVQVGDKILLLGIGSGCVNMLYDFGHELPLGFETENKSSLKGLLKSAVRKP